MRFHRALQTGYDCVFGTRIAGGGLVDGPLLKRILNRPGTTCIRALFMMRYNDVTNAFKLCRRSVMSRRPAAGGSQTVAAGGLVEMSGPRVSRRD